MIITRMEMLWQSLYGTHNFFSVIIKTINTKNERCARMLSY